MKIKFSKITILAIWILSIPLLIVNPCLSAGRPSHADQLKPPRVVEVQAEIPKILAVLEGKVEDHDLLETAKKKLLTLDRRKTQLLSSLCDRIVNDGQSTGSDVAFLVITILIVLS